uniref:Retrovirus-related Pol polyprotein from transposon TNT 1-94 n=1 Tax=Cajanus cajan TaxID=3821 RepID=A0A151TAF7_CAJCA|nr:Retrovirus-related Pol polyprotein from transposon TNT 1-94 [Cajanus cajan]
MNHAINDIIRCMLSHAELPKVFWDEVLRIVLDLINLSPSIPLDSDVSKKVWRRKDPSYSHLRVFGYKAFIHIPKDKRFKLDVCFLGLCHDDFGYKFWDSIDKKIVRSRDIVFLEGQTIKDINKKEKAKQVTREDIDVEPKPPSRATNIGEMKFLDEKFIILLLYVGDMLIVGYDMREIQNLKRELNNSFAMKDLDPTRKIIGIKIIHDRKNGNCGYHNKSTLRMY